MEDFRLSDAEGQSKRQPGCGEGEGGEAALVKEPEFLKAGGGAFVSKARLSERVSASLRAFDTGFSPAACL